MMQVPIFNLNIHTQHIVKYWHLFTKTRLAQTNRCKNKMSWDQARSQCHFKTILLKGKTIEYFLHAVPTLSKEETDNKKLTSTAKYIKASTTFTNWKWSHRITTVPKTITSLENFMYCHWNVYSFGKSPQNCQQPWHERKKSQRTWRLVHHFSWSSLSSWAPSAWHPWGRWGRGEAAADPGGCTWTGALSFLPQPDVLKFTVHNRRAREEAKKKAPNQQSWGKRGLKEFQIKKEGYTDREVPVLIFPTSFITFLR